MSIRFQINEPDVAVEIFDGEILAIHLGTGNYYSFRGSANPVWLLVAQGALEEEVVASMEVTFAAEPGVIRTEVGRFIQELVAEGLIVADPNRSRDAGPSIAPQDRAPFVPPKLERYSDMGELLLLDPIHDVDNAGWPVVPEPGK